MKLQARFAPQPLPQDRACDAAFELEMENHGHRSVEIYLDGAEYFALCGWAGPKLQLLVREGGAPWPTYDEQEVVERSFRLVAELRTWYGPPGHPPEPSYWERFRRSLEPGQTLRRAWGGCFLPRSLVKPAHLATEQLDPEGMDGLARMEQASCLVIGKSAAQVLAERKRRRDFLRPGLVIFFPRPGAYQFKFIYWHEAGGFLEASQRLLVEATPITVEIP